MRQLYMSDEEIARNFREAADKKAQIGILADLNAVDKRVIHNKLVSLGLLDGEIIPEKQKEQPTVGIDESIVRSLIEDDVPDKEIAARFDVSEAFFLEWRRGKGIMRYQKKRHKKSVKELQEMTKETEQASAVEELAERVVERVNELEKNVQQVKVAEDGEGMTASGLCDLLAKLDKIGEAARVTVGGKKIRSVFVGLRFDRQSGDAPAEMTVELEV